MKNVGFIMTMVVALGLLSGLAAQAPQPPPFADVFGMTVQELTPQVANLLGIDGGVQVVAVEAGSEAARAEVVVNDVITQVNGVSVKTVAELFERLEKSPGTRALRVRSVGKTKTLEVPRPKVTGKIVFRSGRSGNGDIYVMNADGTGLTRLTDSPGDETNPVYSPDGQRIAFTGAVPNGFWEIFVMNADGLNVKRLTNTPFAEILPRWSPDGKFLYFVTNRNQKWEIWRMGADGSNPEAVVECSPRLETMAWSYPEFDLSPDGSLLLYPRYRETHFDLAVRHLPSKATFALAPQIPPKLRPHFSKDGSKILVTAPGWSPYIVDAQTGDAVPLRLTHPLNLRLADPTTSITWSPKGDYFVVTGKPSANELAEVYVISTDGNVRQRLTFNAADDIFADWTEGTKARLTRSKNEGH